MKNSIKPRRTSTLEHRTSLNVCHISCCLCCSSRSSLLNSFGLRTSYIFKCNVCVGCVFEWEWGWEWVREGEEKSDSLELASIKWIHCMLWWLYNSSHIFSIWMYIRIYILTCVGLCNGDLNSSCCNVRSDNSTPLTCAAFLISFLAFE